MIQTAFIYGPFVVWFFTLFTFVRKCRAGWWARVLWSLALLVCFAKFWCYRTLGGEAFNPELPEVFIWLWNGAYSGAVILFGLSLLTCWIKFPKRMLLLPILAWSLAAWGMWNGIRSPRVQEITLEYPDLPPTLDGYRIVQLSDLHISSAARGRRTERIVEIANACTGDVIVITGDIVDGYPTTRERDVQPLRHLKAHDGVYAITGNHERYYNFPIWHPFYKRWGIRFLSKECVFPRPGLALGGVDDYAIVRRHHGDPEMSQVPAVGAAFAAATNGEFRVLLQHQPKEAFENFAQQKVRLQLSGHTHGGICPGMAYLVQKFNRGFVRGIYAFAGARLYVSPGAGQWAGFPIRFFNPSEITIFTLKKRSS